VADDVQKQENQPEESAKDNANSAQARKDQKRREAELRTQTQPLRKEIARLEKEMEKLNATLATVEEKLGDSGLYDQSRKAELTDCLQTQAGQIQPRRVRDGVAGRAGTAGSDAAG
jgi:ATP-binding cassette subfamily F protein 3